MNSTELVLIDTCIWVPYFNRPRSTEKSVVDSLLDDDRAAITGPILTEILQGFRRDEHADWVASLLRNLQVLEPRWDDWRQAAKLGRDLASKGKRLPLTDLVVAALGLRFKCAVYTTDPHFEHFPGLRRAFQI
jgi:predicted nucleic acid-binding protein